MMALFSRRFKKEFDRLPADIQLFARLQIDRWKQNQYDTRLHLKKLKGETSAYSIRITRSYRAIFIWEKPDEALFVTIDHRKDVYRI